METNPSSENVNLDQMQVCVAEGNSSSAINATGMVGYSASREKKSRKILKGESESESECSDSDSDYHPTSSDDFDEEIYEELENAVEELEGSDESKESDIDYKVDSYEEANIYKCRKDDIECEMYVRCSRKKNNKEGRLVRDYDSRNACLFCGKLLKVLIARHYLSKQHEDKPEVCKIKAMPVGAERKKELTLLRNRGNYVHNQKVHQTKQGEIILLRRPPDKEFYCPDDYGPCPQCLGYVLKDNMVRHASYFCVAKKDGQDSKKKKKNYLQMESDMLLNIYQGANPMLKTTVLASMKRDSIFDILSRDPLILELGNQFLKKQVDRKAIVSEKMRAAGRLVQSLRQLDPDRGSYITDFLKPSKFDLIIEATEALSTPVEKEGRDELLHPSVAIKSGHDLVWLAKIKRGQALRRGDTIAQKEAENYLCLHQAEWGLKVSAAATATLNVRKCNKSVTLPKTSDIKIVSDHLIQQINQLLKKIGSKRPDFEDYRRLQKLTLARLILFNKRRPLEMSKLSIKAVVEQRNSHKCQIEELSNYLSPLEKKLSEVNSLIKIIGKRGRGVHVIVPQECQAALDLLIGFRKSVNIPDQNNYVFARQTLSSYLRGGEVIKELIKEIDLESPETIRPTLMRQYSATVSQVLSLGRHEMEWLADHMGHDINIHKHFYRLQESSVELCKVSKLLIAIDRGEVGNWAGKTLDDIEIEDIPVYPDNEENGDIPSYPPNHFEDDNLNNANQDITSGSPNHTNAAQDDEGSSSKRTKFRKGDTNTAKTLKCSSSKTTEIRNNTNTAKTSKDDEGSCSKMAEIRKEGTNTAKTLKVIRELDDPGGTAIPGQLMARTEQAPIPWPNLKNQFNVEATQ